MYFDHIFLRPEHVLCFMCKWKSAGQQWCRAGVWSKALGFLQLSGVSLITHRGAGRGQLLQHVGDDDLQQSFSEELLAHCAAVIIVFLRRKNRNTFYSECCSFGSEFETFLS